MLPAPCGGLGAGPRHGMWDAKVPGTRLSYGELVNGRLTCRLRTAMAKLTGEQQRALWLMAGSPKGCTKAVLMAYGCPIEMLEKLVTAGLAETWTEEIISPHPSRSLSSWSQKAID